ncbi:MAG: hypothetical protein ACR2M6_02585 [Vampirovibrionia bacterium]
MSILSSNTFLEWVQNSFGTNQSWNDYWEDYYKTDPTLSRVRFCMDLVFGSSHRALLSTDKITTTSSITGVKYAYLPYMESAPTLSSEYQIGTGNASQRSFSMTVSGKSIGDPINLLDTNFMLAGFVEISLQFDGGDYDKRLVIMRGEMDSVNFGNKDEYIEFDVVEIDKTFSKIIPDVFITKDKFEFCGDDVIGMRYPLVFDRHFAVPCIRLEDGEFGPKFMICQSHSFEVVTVYVDGLAYSDTNSSYPHSIEYLIDKQGVPYTAINFDFIQGNPEFSSGVSVYAEVRQISGRYRGIIDVIEDILGTYSQFGVESLDRVLFGKSKAKIGQIELQTLINGSDTDNATRATQFVEETICSQLPMVSTTYTYRGYGVVVTDLNAIPVGEYNSNLFPFIDRNTGLQEISKKELFSSFTIRYHYNPLTDTYERILKMDSSNNEKCRRARFQIGEKEHDIIESVYIYNDETALAILSWLADHKTNPCYYVEYTAYPILYFRLDVGDNIIFSDEKLGLSRYTCTVTKKSLEGNTCIIGMKIWT